MTATTSQDRDKRRAAQWNSVSQRNDVTLRNPDGISDDAELTDLVTSCQRPSVLMTERETSVLRRGLTKQGWKRSLYLQPLTGHTGIHSAAGLLSRANRGMERTIQMPRQAGSPEDFYCRCGARLRIPDDLQIAPDYECTCCGERSGGAAFDAAIRFFQLEDIVGTALDLALIFAIEKDKAYAEKAADILLDYAEAYGSNLAVTQDSGVLMARPEDEAVSIIALAQAYDLIYYCRKLSEDHRKRIEDLLRQAAGFFRELGVQGAAGSWFLAAVGTVGLALRDVDLIGYALSAARKQLCEEIGEDGLWPGPLLARHFHSLAALVHFAEACCRSGIDLYNWEPAPGRSLKAMFSAPLQCAYPSFRLPAVDGDVPDGFVPLDLYEIACRRWDDVDFACALKKGYKFGDSQDCRDHKGVTDQFRRTSFYAFLFGRDLPGRIGTPVSRDHAFPGLGLSTLRCGDSSMATLRWGHCDQGPEYDTLGFTFYSNDTVLAPECGVASNCVLVDGQCRQQTRQHTLIGAQHGSYICYAMAEAGTAKPAVEHVRRIVLLDGLCIVVDDLASQSDHDYDWIVRCEGEVQVAGSQAQAKTQWSGHPLVSVHKTFDLGAGRRATWTGGNGRVDLALWGSEPRGLLAVGDCLAETASQRACMIACRQHAGNAQFAAALATSDSGQVDLSKDGPVISVTRGNQTDHIYVGSGDPRESSQRLQTDGEVAAIRVRGGRLQAMAIVGGSVIKWDGHPVMECPGRTECAQVTFAERSPVVTYQGGIPGTLRIRTTARAMRVNGHRTAAATSDGHALLRIDARMLSVRGTEVLI